MGRGNTAAAVKRFTPSVPTPQSQGRRQRLAPQPWSIHGNPRKTLRRRLWRERPSRARVHPARRAKGLIRSLTESTLEHTRPASQDDILELAGNGVRPIDVTATEPEEQAAAGEQE
jgi:hypothetical protein